MVFTHAQIPNLEGKVALVTGGGNGIGFETALSLALNGAHVIITARSDTRAVEALAQLNAALESNRSQRKSSLGKIEALTMNNEDLNSVKKFAHLFLARSDIETLDILVLNAGIFLPPFKLLDGIESQFMVNHLAHYYLARLLLPKLQATEKLRPVRLVIVSSDAAEFHPDTKIDFTKIADPNLGKMYCYYRSKLGNVLLSRGLNARISSGSRIYVNSLHPGHVATNIGSGMQLGTILTTIATTLVRILQISGKDGALASLYLATSPEVETNNIRNKFFFPYGVERLLKDRECVSDSAVEECWAWCETAIERIVGVEAFNLN
ncbi:hypothetical protein HK100_000169 [Physocladia obscura]|uniref:NAD(P)-binding protein n=1 Tax=Physocladia obscura TaxID=109957 RepID=A0AAD5SYT2_9FUNG|nr:hypothetical protein HK100_000169 [Physocladia obscura]